MLCSAQPFRDQHSHHFHHVVSSPSYRAAENSPFNYCKRTKESLGGWFIKGLVLEVSQVSSIYISLNQTWSCGHA